jgi:sec-independent protein translocase protein TatA
MGGIGPPELIIILLLFVLLFGAKKLPELGGSIGKSIKNFKAGIEEGKQNDELPSESSSHSSTGTSSATPPETSKTQ